MSAEYNYEELEEWNEIVIEVTTSWQRISDFTSEKFDSRLLQTEDVRRLAYAIASRWLFPIDETKTTSITEIRKLYLPKQLMPELLGEYEAVVYKKSYDKARPCLKLLCEAELIERMQKGKEVHYKPTEKLLNYCVDCSQILKEKRYG